MHLPNRFHFKRLLIIGLFTLSFSILCAQDEPADSTRATIGENLTGDTLQLDTIRQVESAALDIGQNRGLFITTPDGIMQMRILGSIRYLVVYDQIDLTTKNHLNTFEIPVPQAGNLPNYYNSVSQSRLGFEVSRKLSNQTVFVRLETDFAGPNNSFRIRHAYGQFGHFILGQTWSLFTHISALPAMVDFDGPTGSVAGRTPQIRFTFNPLFENKSTLSLALEYVVPEVTIPDSLFVSVQQLMPDITASISMPQNWGSIRVSGIIPLISAQYQDDLFISAGYGLTGSAIVNTWLKGKWYLRTTFGKGISRFYNDFSGQGFDYIYSPENQEGIFPHTISLYATYEHRWTNKVYSNISYGCLYMEKNAVFTSEEYRSGHSIHINTFWDIIEGARMGVEIANGIRVNQHGGTGDASRLNLLFYYDF